MVSQRVPNNTDKWMNSQNWPATIAQEKGVVFALNSDFAHVRIQQKSIAGVIIRSGEIYSQKTRKNNAQKFPNLDTLALFPDGDMQVFQSNEHTANEYIQVGAVDVLAFGPILIRDGVLNKEGLQKFGRSKAPRTVIGMIEKGHYIAIMVEGRHSKSKGTGIEFPARKLYEKGCVTAMNLDGGQTATMIFMGKQIIKVGQTNAKDASARKTSEILGIGYSEELQKQE